MRNFIFLLPALLLLNCHDDDDDAVVVILAADINKDGFGDLIIGAPLHDGGGALGANRGAIFIRFGSAAGPLVAPGITIFGAEDGAQFGFSVALLGDINGDELPDFVVGAPFDDADANAVDDGIDRGRAFIFFGGAGMDTLVDVVMTGAEPGACLGMSVARAGDINGDSLDDWLVGAPLDDGDGNGVDDGTDRGRAFLYLGGSPPNGTEDITFTGSEASSRFGAAVSSAGDINFGGAFDIAVGAPLDDGDGNATEDGLDRGRVFVYYGGGVLDNIPDLTMTGDEAGAQLGAAVANVFDVNNDGRHDLLVGAPRHDAGGAPADDMGRAYVFFGGTAVDIVPDLTISGTEVGGRLGSSVSRLGDVNGDGQNDWIVGAPFEDPAALVDAGRAYIFLGGTGTDAVADLVLAGVEVSGNFGSTVAGFGDTSGGARDVYVGANMDDGDGNAVDDGLERGASFVFFGGAAVLDAVSDVTVFGGQDLAESGTAIGN